MSVNNLLFNIIYDDNNLEKNRDDKYIRQNITNVCSFYTTTHKEPKDAKVILLVGLKFTEPISDSDKNTTCSGTKVIEGCIGSLPSSYSKSVKKIKECLSTSTVQVTDVLLVNCFMFKDTNPSTLINSIRDKMCIKKYSLGSPDKIVLLSPKPSHEILSEFLKMAPSNKTANGKTIITNTAGISKQLTNTSLDYPEPSVQAKEWSKRSLIRRRVVDYVNLTTKDLLMGQGVEFHAAWRRLWELFDICYGTNLLNKHAAYVKKNKSSKKSVLDMAEADGLLDDVYAFVCREYFVDPYMPRIVKGSADCSDFMESIDDLAGMSTTMSDIEMSNIVKRECDKFLKENPVIPVTYNINVDVHKDKVCQPSKDNKPCHAGGDTSKVTITPDLWYGHDTPAPDNVPTSAAIDVPDSLEYYDTLKSCDKSKCEPKAVCTTNTCEKPSSVSKVVEEQAIV